eukprot:364855-Chlamydomonas_euryale.AAC.7
MHACEFAHPWLLRPRALWRRRRTGEGEAVPSRARQRHVRACLPLPSGYGFFGGGPRVGSPIHARCLRSRPCTRAFCAAFAAAAEAAGAPTAMPLRTLTCPRTRVFRTESGTMRLPRCRGWRQRADALRFGGRGRTEATGVHA